MFSSVLAFSITAKMRAVLLALARYRPSFGNVKNKADLQLPVDK
jgi:hypothetical protein